MTNFRGFLRVALSITVVTLTLFLTGVTHAVSVHCDFNNDGFDDLAIGVPGERVNGRGRAGAVNVLYGRAGGLSAANNQFWTRDSANVLGAAAENDRFGLALACGDFNGDGLDDLAISAPESDVNGAQTAGSVTILYGTSKWRLSATGNQLWTQDSPGVLNAAELNDFFGWSLAAGDFNDDGFADLAVGIPGESRNAEEVQEGAVQILYGTSSGLSSTGNQFWTQDSAGIVNEPQSNESFGVALIAGDFGKDTSSGCFDDLAIGVPGETLNDSGCCRGAVHVLYGASTGLSASGSQFWTEDTPGIPETAESGDFFGSSLTAGNFRGLQSVCGTKKIADLVVGAVFERINSVSDAGAVFIIYGTNSGLTATDSQIWHEDSPGIAEQPEEFDVFGHAIATGHTTAGDFLAIGAPYLSGTQSTTFARGGVVHILRTDPLTGLVTASGSKLYHQNTPGIKDSVEFADHFGLSLATGDFNADGQDDLAVGVPNEALNGLQSVGAIHILYGASPSFSPWFHQNSADIKDVEEFADQFGYSLSN